MNKVPPELLQKIKAAVNLIEVVGEHVVLRKAGSNFVGLCPFHAERTPSFSVSEPKQLYHCYGCKKGGDLIRFVMEMHGISFPEALAELAERARIALPREIGFSGAEATDPETARKLSEAREKKAIAHKLNRFAAQYYHQNLSNNQAALQYFRNRGVNAELKRNFYVGAATREWDGLYRFLKEKKAPLPLAQELGLIRSSPKIKNEYFDLFRSRALFPILDLRGKIAGFGGRLLPGEEGREDSPKYLNSPESLLYHKDRLAFGLYQAQKHIREKDELILVEGYFDVLALHAAGFLNAVATCGTALSSAHLQVFRRLCSRIVVLFDGDEAGIQATERAMESGLDEGLVLFGARLPDELDPDEILFDLKQGTPLPDGKERLESLLKNAKPLLDEKMEIEMAKAHLGPEEKTQAIKRLGGWLQRFKDPIGKEIRFGQMTIKLGIPRGILQKLMGELASGTRGGNPFAKKTVAPSALPKAPSKREKMLLSALFWNQRFQKLLEETEAGLPSGNTLIDLFEFKPIFSFLKTLTENHSNHSSPYNLLTLWREVAVEGNHLLDACQNTPEVRSLLTEFLLSENPPYPDAEVRGALLRSTSRLWARFSQQIKLALAQAEAKRDAGLQSQLMKDYLDVQRKMKEFNSFYDQTD